MIAEIAQTCLWCSFSERSVSPYWGTNLGGVFNTFIIGAYNISAASVPQNHAVFRAAKPFGPGGVIITFRVFIVRYLL